MAAADLEIKISAAGAQALAEFRKVSDSLRQLQRDTAAVGQSSANAAGSVGNLTAQFNDIGVMIAAGQSPLQLAIQQGTQISQVFAGQGAAGAVKMLGSAFVGLFSPVSIATIALTAGVAIIGQWALKALGATEDTKDLADQIDSLSEAVDDYVDAANDAKNGRAVAEDLKIPIEQARELLRVRKETLRVEAEQALAATTAKAEEALPEIEGGWLMARPMLLERKRLLEEIADVQERADKEGRNFSGTILELTGRLEETREVAGVVETLGETFLKTEADASNLAFALARLDDSATPEAQARQWAQVREALIEAAGGVDNLSDEGRKLLLQTYEVESGFLKIAAVDLATPMATAAGSANEFSEFLRDAHQWAQRTKEELEQLDLERAVRSVGRVPGRNIDGAIPSELVARIIGVESGGDPTARARDNGLDTSAEGLGQFVDGTFIYLFRKYYDEAKGMTDEAIKALKTDAEISTELVRLYAEENAQMLREAGVAVNATSIYLAHFLGPQDAIDVLQNPNLSIGMTVSPASIRSNPRVLGGDKTGNDLINWAADYIGDTGETLDLTEAVQANEREAAEDARREAEREVDEAKREAEEQARKSEAAQKAETAAIERAEDAYRNFAASLDPVLAARKAMVEGQETIDEALKRGVITAEEAAVASVRLAEKVEKMRQEALLAADTAEAANLRLRASMADSVTSVIGSELEAIVTGAKSAKDAFADMGMGILQTIAKIMAARFTEKFIDPIVEALFSIGAPSLGGGATPGAMPPPSPSFIGPMPAMPRAKGGPVHPGQLYLVGEEGPELAVFGQSGTIIPNGQWESSVMADPWATLGPKTKGSPGERQQSDKALSQALGKIAANGPTKVIVNNTVSDKVDAQVSTRSEGGQDLIEITIERAVDRVTQNIAMGGSVSQALEGSYGLNRRGM